MPAGRISVANRWCLSRCDKPVREVGVVALRPLRPRRAGGRSLRAARGLPDQIKLFDLEADPQELDDLSAKKKDVAASLFDELKARLDEANQPFQR